MEANEIEKKVTSLVADQMGIEKNKITLDTSFKNDLNSDSLDMVELVMVFEDTFNITISESDMENMQFVGQVVDYICDHQKGG